MQDVYLENQPYAGFRLDVLGLGQHFTGVLESPAVGCYIHFLGVSMRFDLDFAVLVQVMRADKGAGAAEDGIALVIQDTDGLEIGGVYDRSKLV